MGIKEIFGAGMAVCLCVAGAHAAGEWRSAAKAAAGAAVKETLPEQAGKAPDSVIAAIGGTTITQADLDSRLNTLIALQQAGLKSDLSDRAKTALKNQLQKSALGDMIDMALLDQVAAKKGIQTSTATVDSGLEPLKAAAKAQGLDFDAFCTNRLGVSSAALTDYLTKKTIAQDILDQEVRDRVTVGDSEIDAWLKANPDSTRAGAERVLRLQKTAAASAEYLAALRAATPVSTP